MLTEEIEYKSIKRLSIRGLFGNQNIDIPFTNNIMILMGENGTGKTSILNILYYTLNRNYRKLRELPFNEVEVSFSSGNAIKINKRDLLILQDLDEESDVINYLTTHLEDEDLLKLTEMAEREDYDIFSSYFREIFREKYRDFRVPTRLAYRELKKKNRRLELIDNILKEEIYNEILYLPTYRRIEEDLNKLGVSNIDLEDQKLIKFGLNDVEKRIEKITLKIKELSIKWFAKVNGEMLTELIYGISVTDEMKNSLQNKETLEIVLSRTGESLILESKNRIYELLESNEIFEDSKYSPLVFFLSNLIKIYDQQTEYDNAINRFVNACNKYLYVSKKKFEYDESNVELKLYKKTKNKKYEIKLSSLSSGEKQIVSLFSRLHLEINESKYLILFDEPELSLSTDWQSELLPDIIASKKCSFMFVVTHSPFIFENNLETYARSLDMYIDDYEESSDYHE